MNSRDLERERRRAGDRQAQLAAEPGLELGDDQLVGDVQETVARSA